MSRRITNIKTWYDADTKLFYIEGSAELGEIGVEISLEDLRKIVSTYPQLQVMSND